MIHKRLGRGALALSAVALTATALALPSFAQTNTTEPSSQLSGAAAVPKSGKMAVPSADLASIANKYGKTRDQVAAHQKQLAPIIESLAPSAKQPTVAPRLKVAVAADAKPDDCFQAIGQGGPTPDAQGNCPAGYTPKFDSGYVYGSTVAGDNFFFGTVGNSACAGSAAYFKGIQPFATDEIACEGSGGPNGRDLGWTGGFGDFARNHVIRHDTNTDISHDITPTDEQAPSFKYGTGVRGGGSKDGVALLTQTILNPDGRGYRGVELLAYDGVTGEFLAETVLPQYFNIRNGQIINGELYFGVRLAGTGTGAGGGIIKWTGSKADPFSFEVVAQGLKSEPAYMVLHDGHIVTSGWGTLAAEKAPLTSMAEMYRSPAVPAKGGLTSATADASNWTSIFKMSDFEPDPVLARAMNFGDITSYQGKLLFSTYIYAGYNTANAYSYYGEPADDLGKLNTIVNAERPISILQMDNPGAQSQKVRLLYGDAKLSVYNTQTGLWELKNNKLNQTPKFGPAGFGNRYNYYSWMWQQYKGSLYMSTFDVSSVVNGVFEGFNPGVTRLSPMTVDLLQPVLDLAHQVQGGADVWRFDDVNAPATAETTDGFGNRNLHGVRAWGAFPSKGKLYAGMTSWRNLKEGWRLNALNG